MDVLLLGVAAIVLIALTVWIVWRPGPPETTDGAVRAQEAPHMLPQGERFEDQYTSATADLSAGGVAVSSVHETAAPIADTSDFQRAAEPWSDPSLARAGVPASPPLMAEQPRATERAAMGARTSVAASMAERTTLERTAADRRTTERTGGEPTGGQRPMTVGVGVAALLTVGGAAAGAWLYSRWLQERNKPLKRLRRLSKLR